MPKRSASSRRWLREHAEDPYVLRAQQEGYRSRSAYKLLEMQARDRLVRPGMRIVDLGAAPGGWSQVAAGLVGERGIVVASDILPMAGLEHTQFVQGDFTEHAIAAAVVAAVGPAGADLVLSDMAPNMTGMKSVDQPRALYLAELAFDLATRVLKQRADFLVKVFQGEGSEAYVKMLRARFERVVVRKPRASRDRSSEVYVLARGYDV